MCETVQHAFCHPPGVMLGTNGMVWLGEVLVDPGSTNNKTTTATTLIATTHFN